VALIAGVAAVLAGASASPASGASVITTRPDDPGAVYLSAPDFSVHPDGSADDTAAIQSAIDRAAAANANILFIPSGRYRVTRTLYVWRGVRLIGYGATRPVFVLPPNTPGYQQGIGLMVMFSAGRPGGPGPGRGGPGPGRVPFPPPGQVPPNTTIPDANPGTFYPGMTNIDFEIGDGNPGAVAIRFHVAQHGILSHMDFHVGSGLAALTQIGNEVEDLRIYGGRYGILTDNTSPYWPFTILDSLFEGQREAAIREHQAGLTVVRTTFRSVPVAIDLDPTYSDQLWIKESRFEHVAQAGVVISNERNGATMIGAEQLVCSDVPVFARFRESGRTQAAPAPVYRVASFNYGLFVPAPGATGRIDIKFEAAPLASAPDPLPPAIQPFPASDGWVNVHSLGVKGDGTTDDTEAIRAAVAQARVLYFPSGYYIVKDTIQLKPDTVVIALHPGTTQWDLPDATPAFQGVGAPKALLETPQSGTNIVSGLGIYTGGVNPRATGIRWMAGEQSLLIDIQFHGFAGTFLPPAVRTANYPGLGRGGGQFASGRWGAQYPSLWVTQGGGGTFANIWTPNTFAQAGMLVTDTTTPGHVYELSAEHHLFNEVKLDRVENWEFNAPQTEEEAATSPEAVGFEISSSKHITIANYHGYRVTRSHMPAPAALRVYNSSDIRLRNVHVKAESGYGICDENGCGTFLRASRFPYDNSVQDMTHRLDVREREFAVLDLGTAPAPPPARSAAAVLASGATVKALETGFYAIGGPAVGSDGTLYFVDPHQHRIFSWSRERGLSIVSDAPVDPVNLAVDKSGALLVVSSAGREGTVYSYRPGDPLDRLTVVTPRPRAAHEGAAVALPKNVWVNGEFADQLNFETFEYTTLAQMFAREVSTPEASEYVSPDGSVFLRAGRVFRQGPDDQYPGMDTTGWRWSHNLDTFGLVTALPGRRIYLVSGAENRTYRATVRPDGTLGDLEPFAERGGESVAEDASGNVYVANGQVFVYDASGRPIGEIDVPERPIGLIFGGVDRRTLFVLTHHTLYGVETRAPGARTTW
jgi:sugar lactone lactonase YvrE